MANVQTIRGRFKLSKDYGLRKEYCGHTSLLLSMLSMMMVSTERDVGHWTLDVICWLRY